jgi:hypothetical protein
MTVKLTVWLMTVAYRMLQKSLYRERGGRLNTFIFDYFMHLYYYTYTLFRNIFHFVGYIFDDIQLPNYSYCWQYTNFCPHPSSNSASMILCIWCKSLGFLRETLSSWCPYRKIAWCDISLLGKATFGTHFTFFVCDLICTPSLMWNYVVTPHVICLKSELWKSWL